MKFNHWYFSILLTVVASLTVLRHCHAMLTTSDPAASPLPRSPSSQVMASSRSHQAVIQESWVAYRDRFIQTDGRVVDREADDRSTSEGQAYAMLRAVMIGDRQTFDRALDWAEKNLRRTNGNKPLDTLWAWKWGRSAQGEWKILDPNFASDADIDAITALILASRRWQNDAYLTLARTKLQDLWNISTVSRIEPTNPVSTNPAKINSVSRNPIRTRTHSRKQTRILLPGPAIAFQKGQIVQLNPSYFAPYAFRLFAQVDTSRDWLGLVDSSYEILQQAATISRVGLPNDWVLMDLGTGKLQPLTTPNPGTSEYGFDAYRVWWRLALDDELFKEKRARQYLQRYLTHLRQLWRSQQKIPARIDLQGKPLVAYEATSQYGMLYFALRSIDPAIARQIEQQKLTMQYRNGFWENDSAYYTQNMVWFGLMPATSIAPFLQERTATRGK